MGASWWTSSSVLSTPAGCVPSPESQRRICRSTLRCYHSSSFSACPFFDCLRLFPVVLLWFPVIGCGYTRAHNFKLPPERAIISKHIAHTWPILKIITSLCHRRWYRQIKCWPLAHRLISIAPSHSPPVSTIIKAIWSKRNHRWIQQVSYPEQRKGRILTSVILLWERRKRAFADTTEPVMGTKYSSCVCLRIVLIRHTAIRKARCMRQCSTWPSPRCNCVEDTCWQCGVRSGVQLLTHTMLVATVPSLSCWI